MLIFNLLSLLATTVSAGVIPGILSHFSSSPSFPQASQPIPQQETCTFTTNPTNNIPQSSSQSPSSPSSSTPIPPRAWNLITHILNTHPMIRHHLSSTSPSIKNNILQTLDLGELSSSSDPDMQGVTLGLVFTTNLEIRGGEAGGGGQQQQSMGRVNWWRHQHRHQSGEGEEDQKKEEAERERGMQELDCLDEAIRKIGERRQMEGSLEFERGTLGFLVYRVD